MRRIFIIAANHQVATEWARGRSLRPDQWSYVYDRVALRSSDISKARVVRLHTKLDDWKTIQRSQYAKAVGFDIEHVEYY